MSGVPGQAMKALVSCHCNLYLGVSVGAAAACGDKQHIVSCCCTASHKSITGAHMRDCGGPHEGTTSGNRKLGVSVLRCCHCVCVGHVEAASPSVSCGDVDVHTTESQICRGRCHLLMSAQERRGGMPSAAHAHASTESSSMKGMLLYVLTPSPSFLCTWAGTITPMAMTARPRHRSTRLDVAVQVSSPPLVREAMRDGRCFE
jgi:hypothetical protein